MSQLIEVVVYGCWSDVGESGVGSGTLVVELSSPAAYVNFKFHQHNLNITLLFSFYFKLIALSIYLYTSLKVSGDK